MRISSELSLGFLYLFSVGRDLKIESVLPDEKMGKVCPPLDSVDLELGKLGKATPVKVPGNV